MSHTCAEGCVILMLWAAGTSERRRIWRGHWSRRWITVVTAFNWGFLTYWLWTGATMYMFNYHRVRPGKGGPK